MKGGRSYDRPFYLWGVCLKAPWP